MTHLYKPVKRATRIAAPGSGRPMEIIVTLYPGGTMGLRHKRSRNEYELPLSTIYLYAVDAEARRLKAERKGAKRQVRACR